MYSTRIRAQETKMQLEGQKRIYGVDYADGVDVSRSESWCWYPYRNVVTIDGLVSLAVDL